MEALNINDSSMFPAESSVAKKANSNFAISNLIDSEIYDEELMKDYMIGIVQNIKIEMCKRNMSLRKLAERACINPSHICKILKYKTNIGLTALIKIACALGVGVNELLPIDGNKRKTNGERFDDITKTLDVKSVNFLLGFAADFVNLNRGNRKRNL